MCNTLEGLPGVTCQLHDVLIHGSDQTEHDTRVRAALTRIRAAGLTLNDKCEFPKKSIKFLGHIIDSEGVHADPDKTSAISKFPRPSNNYRITTTHVNGQPSGQVCTRPSQYQ